MLVQSKQNNLSDIIRDFKKFTSQRIIQSIEKNKQESRRSWLLWLFTKEKAEGEKPASYRFWQADNHAEECLTLPFIWQKLHYIHNNPVRAGVVSKAEEYLKSSAADYFYGRQVGRIKIERIDPILITI